MSGEFAPLENVLEDLTTSLAPGERKRLSAAIATDLRSANAGRIAGNTTPDGDPMTPRKPRPARLARDPAGGTRADRAARMFKRASGPAFLRKTSSAGEAQVGFAGAMARIMRVHHYGLRDTVTRDPSSPQVTYDERPVIGMPAADRARILDRVTAHLDDR